MTAKHKVGDVFFVPGQGPVLIVDVRENTVGWAPHGYTLEEAISQPAFKLGRWTMREDVTTRATPAMQRRFHAQGLARNVACLEPDCWCVKTREEKT